MSLISPQAPMIGPKPQALPELPPVMALPFEAIPPRIRDFVADTAERMQCPPDFVAVSALCALSAIIGNKIRVRPKANDDWEIVPNLWGAIIGRPSAMKSPSMKAALAPLHALEASYRDEFESEHKHYLAEIELADIAAKAAKDAAKKEHKAGNADVALQMLRDGMQQPDHPTRKRLVVNDTTMEKLADLMNENPSGLLLERDELAGWLARMGRDDAKAERAFYLECFDGNGSFTVDRIGRGTIDVSSTTLAIIGGIQPSKIAPLIRGAITGSEDDGLIQRFQLTVWPDVGKVWEYRDRQRSRAAHDNYKALFDELAGIECQNEPLMFSDEAREYFIQWYTETQIEARSGDLHPAIESHLVKLPKAAAAIAAIYELCGNRGATIGAEATVMALEFMDYLRSHSERFYSIATQGGVEGAKLILRRRNQIPTLFKPRDIQRKGWAGLTTKEDVAAALEVLEDHHHIVKSWPEPDTNRFIYQFNGG
tara:strand:- start:2267 stop:3715 length:1449 start_codon:yes stop_codon:yes gene_type:complete